MRMQAETRTEKVVKEHQKPGLYQKYFKRPMDFMLALCASIVLSPVLLVTAMLVGAKLGSPVIFMQQRPGLNEKIFTIYKFRTMADTRDENGNLLPDELRLTNFGKVLRSTSLDEIPELYNILKGDMSLIGPRPLSLAYLSYYNEIEKHRHDVRPGLSGLAQISGRNTVLWEARFAYDIQYVNNITFWGDIKIIFRTVLKVIGRDEVVVRGTDGLEDFHIFRAKKMRRNMDESGRGKSGFKGSRAGGFGILKGNDK